MHFSKYIFYFIFCLNSVEYLNGAKFLALQETTWQPRQRDGCPVYRQIPASCITRKEIAMDNCFCEMVYLGQPVNLIYHEKHTNKSIILAWKLLKEHLNTMHAGIFDSYKEHEFGIQSVPLTDSLWKFKASYNSARKLNGDYSFEDNPLGMSVYSNNHNNILVHPNMPFRAFSQMADGITFPEVKAFCTIHESGALLPSLEFDYGRIQVFLEAVKDSRFTFHINNSYKGYIDANDGLLYRTEFMKE